METSDSLPPPPPPLISFSLLPNDIVLNCLARISKDYHPTLSLVSKSFRSILSSRELYATRTLIGKTENCLYVCLNLHEKGSNDPCWFELSRNPKHQKLIPIPRLPHKQQHPFSSTILSNGSKIYLIGGTVRFFRSNKVFLLDCQSHQWRRLPDMRVARETADAYLIDGKVYVIGGSSNNDEAEVYDPKTQTWEPLCATEINLIIQKFKITNCLLKEGGVYSDNHMKYHMDCFSRSCFVELDDMMYNITLHWTELWWCDPVTNLTYSVKGLEGLLPDSYNTVMVNPRVGRRVTLCWKINLGREGECITNRYDKEGKTEIWCAEISLERRSFNELWGSVEWSKCVFTYNRYNAKSYFFLQSAVVTL